MDVGNRCDNRIDSGRIDGLIAVLETGLTIGSEKKFDFSRAS